MKRQLLNLLVVLMFAVNFPGAALIADEIDEKIFAESDYIVRLRVASLPKNRQPPAYDPFADPDPSSQWNWSQLTGFVIEDDQGKKSVLTAGHGFMNGELNDIQTVIVYFRDGKTQPIETKLAGYSKRLDVALIEFEDQLPLADIPAVPLNSSADARVGQNVLSIGYPQPFSDNRALTTGKIVNLSVGINQYLFNYPQVIIHDCAINHGGSGSPLISKKGEVLGINVAFWTPRLPDNPQPGQWQYLLADKFSVAVPIDDVKRILPNLKNGEVRHAPLSLKFDYTGNYHLYDLTALQIDPMLPRAGLMITHVYGLAFKLGFKPGDIILACDGRVDLTVADLYRRLYLETDLTKHFYFELDRGGVNIGIGLPLSEPEQKSNPP